ncbi:hypothetical protein OQA88_12618 [Cercophora sp. LCS_1]
MSPQPLEAFLQCRASSAPPPVAEDSVDSGTLSGDPESPLNAAHDLFASDAPMSPRSSAPSDASDFSHNEDSQGPSFVEESGLFPGPNEGMRGERSLRMAVPYADQADDDLFDNPPPFSPGRFNAFEATSPRRGLRCPLFTLIFEALEESIDEYSDLPSMVLSTDHDVPIVAHDVSDAMLGVFLPPSPFDLGGPTSPSPSELANRPRGSVFRRRRWRCQRDRARRETPRTFDNPMDFLDSRRGGRARQSLRFAEARRHRRQQESPPYDWDLEVAGNVDHTFVPEVEAPQESSQGDYRY